jgi:hypothetical protein
MTRKSIGTKRGKRGKRGKSPFSPSRKRVLTAGEIGVKNALRFYPFPRPTSPAISAAAFLLVAK